MTPAAESSRTLKEGDRCGGPVYGSLVHLQLGKEERMGINSALEGTREPRGCLW